MHSTITRHKPCDGKPSLNSINLKHFRTSFHVAVGRVGGVGVVLVGVLFCLSRHKGIF